MKLLLLLLFPFLLAACTSAAVTMIKPGQVYQGYPCGNECSAFQKGFETAKQAQLTKLSECPGSEILAETTGCQAYVTEFEHSRPDYSDLKIK